MLKSKIGKVMDGAEEADTSPILTRITNWHFFKQNEYLVPTTVYYAYLIPLPVTPTSDSILEYRLNKLVHELEKDVPKNLEKLTGRIMHHVQDMNTPAHVVPVYHGVKLKDCFEGYSSKHIESELTSIDITEDEYDALCSENNSDVLLIYNLAARNTLHYLYDDPSGQFEIHNSDKSLQIGWKLFWKRFGDDLSDCCKQPFEDIPGFGCYGPLGEQFGQDPLTLQGENFCIDPRVYKQLHRWVLREQIINSLRTLIAIDSLSGLSH